MQLTSSIIKFGLVLSALLPLSSQAAKARLFSEMPREVQNAVSIQSFVVENQLKTDLNGYLKEGYVDITLLVETKGKYRLYEDKTNFSLNPEIEKYQAWKIEILSLPPTEDFLDPISKGLKAAYRGQVEFKVRLNFIPSSEQSVVQSVSSKEAVPLVFSFQACSDKICLLPAHVFQPIELMKKAAEFAERSLEERATDILQRSLGTGGGMGLSLLVLILAGLLTAFTPCVYPLYPITLGLFGRWSKERHVPAILLVLSYAAGLVLVYAIIGLVTSMSGAVFGSITQRPAFLIGMGVLIVLSALVFEGWIHIPILDRAQNFFAKASPEEGSSAFGTLAKAFGMGSSLGIVASPCVGPVLVVLLAWLSTRFSQGESSHLQGLLLFGAFGLGMSLPFIVLGHFILKMGRSPKLGRWTPYFKHVGTLLLLASSLFFFVPGIQILSQSSRGSAEKNFPVLKYSEWNMNQSTVIDFRADWCAACIELEHETFTHPSISKKFQTGEWTFVQVDLTEMTPELESLSTELEIVGLPTVLITNSRGEICKNLRLFGFEGPNAFEKRLERSLTDCQIGP